MSFQHLRESLQVFGDNFEIALEFFVAQLDLADREQYFRTIRMTQYPYGIVHNGPGRQGDVMIENAEVVVWHEADCHLPHRRFSEKSVALDGHGTVRQSCCPSREVRRVRRELVHLLGCAPYDSTDVSTCYSGFVVHTSDATYEELSPRENCATSILT